MGISSQGSLTARGPGNQRSTTTKTTNPTSRIVLRARHTCAPPAAAVAFALRLARSARSSTELSKTRPSARPQYLPQLRLLSCSECLPPRRERLDVIKLVSIACHVAGLAISTGPGSAASLQGLTAPEALGH